MTGLHSPVMPEEVLELLGLAREDRLGGGLYVDATVGPGGHSELMLGAMRADERLVCIDRDAETLELARARLGGDARCSFVHGRFSEMDRLLGDSGITGRARGVLMDFGVSMLQLKHHDRGFSFLADEPLDMRMDRSEDVPTAADIVNRASEVEIARIIYEYGEEGRSRRVARAICERRRAEPFRLCSDLAGVVARALGGGGGRPQGKRGSHVHPATRVFQAFRIEVNDEIGQVRRGMEAAMGMMEPGGRMVCIAYHSLEDREVKNFIRDGARAGSFVAVTKKPLRATPEEVRSNPSARSARLRCAEAV